MERCLSLKTAAAGLPFIPVVGLASRTPIWDSLFTLQF